MHEPMRSPCARLVLLMHSLERADNWRTIIVTVLILNVIAWRATEATGTSDGA